jgi:hypothetical protein
MCSKEQNKVSDNISGVQSLGHKFFTTVWVLKYFVKNNSSLVAEICWNRRWRQPDIHTAKHSLTYILPSTPWHTYCQAHPDIHTTQDSLTYILPSTAWHTYCQAQTNIHTAKHRPTYILPSTVQHCHSKFNNYMGDTVVRNSEFPVPGLDKLHPGLLWQKQHSKRRKFFSPANWI